MQETGDSGRQRLMLSLLLSLDRKFAMASLTTCNEADDADGRRRRGNAKQERLSRGQPQAGTLK